jgi:hypothetical protein
MLEFFGGVSEILVPDNLKSALTKACRYDPELTRPTSNFDLRRIAGTPAIFKSQQVF